MVARKATSVRTAHVNPPRRRRVESSAVRPGLAREKAAAVPGELGSQSGDADIAALKAEIDRLLDALLARGQLLAGQFREWMDTLFETVEHGSAGVKAAVEAAKATLTGKNPVWAAVKGLWTAMSGPAKAALVLLVVVGLLLAPVLLVVLLLALLVVALIAAVRASQ